MLNKFKTIPGNEEYLINVAGSIKDILGNPVKLERTSSNRVKIKLFGKDKELTLTTLRLMSWYEIGSMKNISKKLDSVIFYPISSNILRIGCKYVMYFKKPVYFKPGFRYIPCFPRYAINKNGDILDTFDEEKGYINKFVTKVGYEYVRIYNPDRVGFRNTPVHRLMALAWIHNSQFSFRPYVNHIDGVKNNNELSNLEWCAFNENVKHALDNGLTNTRVKMKTRDCITGEIKVFESLTEMSHWFGITMATITRFDSSLPGYKFRNRYEIKRFDDTSPWYYEENTNIVNADNVKRSLYEITTTCKETGKSSVFLSLSSFYKEFHGIFPHQGGGVEAAILKFKKRYPNHDVVVKRNATIGPYQLIDIDTNERTTYTSILKIAKFTGIGNNELKQDLTLNKKFIYLNKWIVVPEGMVSVFDRDDYINKPSESVGVDIIKSGTSKVVRASSLREAERITKVRRKTISNVLNTGKTVRGYTFRPTSP